MLLHRSVSLVVVLVAFALVVPAAFAEGYVGISGGQADFEVDQSAVRFSLDDTAFKVFGGFPLNKWLTADAQYVSLNGLESQVGDVSVEFDGDVLTAFLVGGGQIAPRVKLWAKLGWSLWRNDITTLAVGEDVRIRVDENGSAVGYGVGAGFLVTERFSLRVEWETFGDLGRAKDVKYVSVGAQYNF